ncbi:MAG: DNA polymerase III subunit gamma/tau [Gammaproteobacteria bacterium]|nr:DNA polymerase III subunit gamma/tau [Gammaproteobacteria bacterium]
MSYQVLARKWRPRNFAELVGQSHVVRPLVNALDHARMHHAFLFTGTRGVGKTTIARILAKSLNCETGVTSTPCGICSACKEVDEGRFVDLIEVDAASRTKVDDTRELLDNVQYAPTRGRYKVYLIDEVHMLSGHSFNALLKTLEEPPPHVKFLLATTDPQKLPVTVLSRCLQFNLKRLSLDEIAPQMQKILDAEGITHDAASIKLLARAADGSMRDGLSLLDQAIAYGGGKVAEAEVRAMLGSIDQDFINRLLQSLAAGDAGALLQAVADATEYGLDYEMLLKELLLSLHRIALAQADPALAGEEGENVLAHARALSPQDVQLYYQIGLLGQRDLPFAPDPRSGLEMTLLRMVAFRPVEAGEVRASIKPVATPTKQSPVESRGTVAPAAVAPVSAPPVTAPAASPPVSAPVVRSASIASTKWSETVAQLGLAGLTRELANNTTLESHADGAMTLILDESRAQLLNKDREAELKQALEKYYGAAIRLTVRLGRPAEETPAKQKDRLQEERQQAAVQAITDDPNVRALQEKLNARINPASIRSKV